MVKSFIRIRLLVQLYSRDKVNKKLIYRREIALQRALVLARSGRLGLGDNIFADIVGLSSTTMT